MALSGQNQGMSNYHRKIQSGSVSYLMIFVVVFLAVVSGNLTTHFIELKLVERAVSKALEMANDEARVATEQRAERQLMLQRKSQAERSRSSTGVKLNRACLDWTNADEQNKTQTTAEGRRRHCKNYDEFIRTGKLP